jgi:hypothetical protein
MTHIVNGHVMSVLIGVEIEGTGKIGMQNLWLKRLA